KYQCPTHQFDSICLFHGVGSLLTPPPRNAYWVPRRTPLRISALHEGRLVVCGQSVEYHHQQDPCQDGEMLPLWSLRCSVADLFKKFSGSVQSSGRSPGLFWAVAKIIGSVRERKKILWNISWP